MPTDTVIAALLDDSVTLIDAIDLLPDECWEEYCAKPYSTNGYSGLTWQEFLAISAFFTDGDSRLIHDVLLMVELNQSIDFKRFLVDKELLTKKRGRKANTVRNRSIYFELSTAKRRYGNKSPATSDLAERLHLSIEAINTVYSNAEREMQARDKATKSGILEHYLLWKSSQK